MFRRIELIQGRHKSGLMGFAPLSVIDAWIMLPCPKHKLRKNCRFYFTEKGWNKFGRATMVACKKIKLDYVIRKVKENTVDIMYRDIWQVAVRYKKGVVYES